jgi:DNA repair protein RecO (recombination protein O)
VRLESTPAIVLRTREYGESDKIVTFLSRTAGKFSGIAKGAKRSQRRFPGTPRSSRT